MTKHYQRGDAGVAMLVVMVALMIGFFWHGGDRGGHMSTVSPASEAAKSPLYLLDEAYARGEIGREEYLQKREDMLKR
ncbi:MAG: SHOCT domain-containing protein [Pseudomonadota bacterium]